MRLEGIRVVDFTHLLPGHYATQLLADMGAEILKVERPDGGNAARQMELGGKRGGLFDVMNHGKKSVALDLQREGDREALYSIVESVDVVFEQFRPGVVGRLGVDYDTLSEYNDDLVYCSLTGFGQSDSTSERTGHDVNYVARAGLLGMTRGGADDSPVIPGYPIADMASGLFTTTCVLGALLERSLGNGSGRYVDISMTDVVASFSQPVAAEALHGGQPMAGETALTGKYPCYDVYETADGRYITVAALEPPFWRQLCAEIGREDLVDRHLSDDPAIREAVREELTSTFAEATLEEWCRRLGPETMTAPVHTIEEMLSDPQLRERGIVLDDETDPPRLGFPAVTEPSVEAATERPPALGEHTEDVLMAAGVDDDTIETCIDAIEPHTSDSVTD